jgi:hypothetical protein
LFERFDDGDITSEKQKLAPLEEDRRQLKKEVEHEEKDWDLF